MREPRNGPASYFSDTLPASRGQWQSIAVLALELLGEPQPKTRLDASRLIGTLRAGLEQPLPSSTAPTSNATSRTNGASSTPVAAPANGTAAPAARTGAARVGGSSRVSRTGVRTAATTPTPAG